MDDPAGKRAALRTVTPALLLLSGRILNVRRADAQFYCLLLAVFLYALAGSPTPDDPGALEALIGIFLAVAAGPQGLRRVLWPGRSAGAIAQAGAALFYFGMTVPLAMAALRAAPVSDVLRDVIPFLFMLMPVFMAHIFESRPARFGVFLCAVIAGGWLFALRSLMQAYGWVLGEGAAGQARELTYWANAPGVLLAACLCIGLPAYRFYRNGPARDAALFAIGGGLAAVPLLAMAMTLQRASLGVFVLFCVLLLAMGVWRRPFLALGLAGAAVLVVLTQEAGLIGLYDALARKTDLYGLNMRAQEFAAVWESVSGRLDSLLLGQGWGAGIESPAVGGLRVNFTHSLPSSMILKAGLLGMALAGIYFAALAWVLARLVFVRPVIALALAGPFVIDLTLYAAYKSLDFGLLLLLIPAAMHEAKRRKIASAAPVMYA